MEKGKNVAWALSPLHNVDDVCDILDGKVFPADNCPVPIDSTHPNCWCELVPTDDDITDKWDELRPTLLGEPGLGELRGDTGYTAVAKRGCIW